MKSAQSQAPNDEMLPSYDFESMPGVEQGRMYRHVQKLRNMRLLDPALAEAFKDDAAVNAALREYLALRKQSA